MEKNFLQDVVAPTGGRSIRNIPINTNRRRRVSADSNSEIRPIQKKPRSTESISQNLPPTPPPPPRTPRENTAYDIDSYEEKRGFRKYLIIGGGLIGIAVLVFILTTFSGAEVYIYPKQAEANVNVSIQAFNKDSSPEDNSLTYQELSVSEESFKTVEATGEEEVKQKASGKITIYNNYTDSSQPLVKNTRFESPDGLIFRIDSSVVVPGKTDSGPGSIEVEVFADSTGEDYNIKPAKFTIPGFKGLPQYESFTAESKESMSGGFVGKRSVVQEDDLENALSEIQSELKEKLEEKSNRQIDSDHILVYNPSSFIFEVLPRDESGKEVKINVLGTLKSAVFNVNELSKYIATESLKNFNTDDNVRIEDISALAIDTTSGEVDEITLNIDGGTNFVWQTDTESLKADLMGMTRKDLKTVLQKYQGITRAEAVIKPFWKKTFPENTEKISIIEKTQ